MLLWVLHASLRDWRAYALGKLCVNGVRMSWANLPDGWLAGWLLLLSTAVPVPGLAA